MNRTILTALLIGFSTPVYSQGFSLLGNQGSCVMTSCFNKSDYDQQLSESGVATILTMSPEQLTILTSDPNIIVTETKVERSADRLLKPSRPEENSSDGGGILGTVLNGAINSLKSGK